MVHSCSWSQLAEHGISEVKLVATKHVGMPRAATGTVVTGSKSLPWSQMFDVEKACSSDPKYIYIVFLNGGDFPDYP